MKKIFLIIIFLFSISFSIVFATELKRVILNNNNNKDICVSKDCKVDCDWKPEIGELLKITCEGPGLSNPSCWPCYVNVNDIQNPASDKIKNYIEEKIRSCLGKNLEITSQINYDLNKIQACINFQVSSLNNILNNIKKLLEGDLCDDWDDINNNYFILPKIDSFEVCTNNLYKGEGFDNNFYSNIFKKECYLNAKYVCKCKGFKIDFFKWCFNYGFEFQSYELNSCNSCFNLDYNNYCYYNTPSYDRLLVCTDKCNKDRVIPKDSSFYLYEGKKCPEEQYCFSLSPINLIESEKVDCEAQKNPEPKKEVESCPQGFQKRSIAFGNDFCWVRCKSKVGGENYVDPNSDDFIPCSIKGEFCISNNIENNFYKFSENPCYGNNALNDLSGITFLRNCPNGNYYVSSRCVT